MDIPGGKNDYGISDPTPRNAAGRIIKGGKFDIFFGRSLPNPVEGLKPQLVLEELEKLGIKSNSWLLADRAKKGLIPQPYTAGCGRGKGKITLHSVDAAAEYYASEELKRILKISLKEVAEIRQIALQGDKKAFWTNIFKNPKNYAAYIWLVFKAKALGQRLPIVVISKKPINPEGITQRTIELELFSVVNHPALEEGIPDGYDFLEILNPVTLTEGETPNFDEWWKMLVKLETNI